MNNHIIGDLLEYVIGGGWGSEAPDGDQNTPNYVIRSADFPSIEKGSFDGVPLRFDVLNFVNKRSLQDGDILLEISGGTKNRPTGRTVYISEKLLSSVEHAAIPASFCRLLRFKKEVVFPKYMYYLLQSWWASGGSWEFQNQSTGIANFQFKIFAEKFEVSLPPLEEQERIAGILGSLDDKIEANTRLIQTMDSYKSTLFQAHICSESEGETIKVSDVATLIRENIAASDIDESMNYVALEHIPRHSLYSHEWTNSEGVMSNKSGFKVGDILFGKLRPYFHKVSIAAVDGIASTDILVLRPKPGFEVLAQSALSSEDLIEYATQVSSGTRMPRASWKDIMNYEVTVKNVEILQESLSGFDTYSRALIHENKVLTETRDALIKRLIG